MTPAERAAQLSARIHREMRLSGDKTCGDLSDFSDDELLSLALARVCLDDEVTEWATGDDVFGRLGAELRAIALGNRMRGGPES